MIKKFVCLADSYKTGGHCIAGIDMDSKQWIRPVNGDAEQGLNNSQIWYNTHFLPQLLDVVEIDIIKKIPNRHQKENVLFNPSLCWKKTGAMSRDCLKSLCSSSLWSKTQSSARRTNNRISSCDMAGVSDSLRMLRLNSSIIEVSEIYNDFEEKLKKETTITFNSNDIEYRIPFKPCSNPYPGHGTYPIDKSHFVTISLSLPFESPQGIFCYLNCAGLIYE